MAKETLTVIINLTQTELESILEKISMDFGTTKTKYFTHTIAKEFKVANVPASCQKLLNEIDDLVDKFGVEYYQGLKVVMNHADLIVACYLAKELKKRSVRVFDKELREFNIVL